MTKDKTANTRHGASVTLEGQTAEDFKAIKQKIESTIPGLHPTNSDVLRFALHLAAHGSEKAG